MSSLPSGASPSHSLHRPYQARSTHVSLLGGTELVGAAEGVVVGSGRLGGDVIVLCSSEAVVVVVPAPDVVSSLHPQNRPGVRQLVLVCVGIVEVVVVVTTLVVLSLHPNQPLIQLACFTAENRIAIEGWEETYGVRQVEVDDVDVDVVVVTSVVSVPVAVVVSSKQPHQPLITVSTVIRLKDGPHKINSRCLAGLGTGAGLGRRSRSARSRSGTLGSVALVHLPVPAITAFRRELALGDCIILQNDIPDHRPNLVGPDPNTPALVTDSIVDTFPSGVARCLEGIATEGTRCRGSVAGSNVDRVGRMPKVICPGVLSGLGRAWVSSRGDRQAQTSSREGIGNGLESHHRNAIGEAEERADSATQRVAGDPDLRVGVNFRDVGVQLARCLVVSVLLAQRSRNTGIVARVGAGRAIADLVPGPRPLLRATAAEEEVVVDFVVGGGPIPVKNSGRGPL